MTEESSTTSHLSVAMITKEMDKMQTTGGNGIVSSQLFGTVFYLMLAVLVMGIVGAVGNALILYAMYVSKQHKKQVLIFNQNVLDFFGSFFVIITYSVELTNPYLSGVFGYCLCIILLSENLIWSAINGSMVNLAIITIDRYLKVVYPVFSRKWQRPWVINTAMAVAWFVGFAYNIVTVISSTAVIDGVCHSYIVSDSQDQRMGHGIFYLIFFYVMILAIIFCYWRILLAIRRQAKVMASHSAAGTSNPSQAQSHKIQSNVIKTMIIVSAFFAIAWAPYDIYCFLTATYLVPSLSYSDSAFFATTFIALIYTCTNPFIYATKFDPVREVLVKMIPCKKKNPVQPTVGAQIAEPRPGPANKRAG